MTTRLCLLTVHAHPDDEASKGPATVARYHGEGVHTVLVCCTGGEEGDVLNPAMDTLEVRADLPAVRRRELDAATAAIGYDEVVMLGYRDSGMPVTYGDDQRGYPHPDHLRVHEVSVAAFDAAGDPGRYPDAGPPFQPLKLYYVGWSSARVLALHDKFLELGLESPFDDGWIERATSSIQTYTTAVDISAFADVRRQALLAHATQVDPSSPFWFGLPPEVARGVHPVDEYVLARSRVGPDVRHAMEDADGADVRAASEGHRPDGNGEGVADPGADILEDDLFAGVRDLASR
jgi:mycothiol S-conjugate amidase